MSVATYLPETQKELLVQAALDFPIDINGSPFSIGASEIPQNVHGLFEADGYRSLMQSACLQRVPGVELEITGVPVYAKRQRIVFPKLIFGFDHGVEGLLVAEGVRYPDQKPPVIKNFYNPTPQQLNLASSLLDIMYAKAAREQFVPSQPYGRLELAS